ncbi:MAG: arylamine N-acetyltransferase [Chloroflexota bacterium]|nr:MAG: arylamine N-acetyltransferase [Chloroflexota bacterium]
MDISAYLQRIRYHGPFEPTRKVLGDLQTAHLLNVPFENLDIHLGRPVLLDEASLFDKIVTRRRGGFCYELNGLFRLLLDAAGFEVICLAASDAHEDGTFGPEFDHLALQVACPGDNSIHWLTDAGWGDTFQQPLRLDSEAEQPQGRRVYRIEHLGEQRLLHQRDENGVWERQYRFSLKPRRFEEFFPTCQYHQTSPDSPFTRKRIVTRLTPTGRITLSEMKLIVSEDGRRQERMLNVEAEYRLALRDYFEIEID